MGAVAEGDAPPFKRVAIFGLGLIGGSIALATRTRWPSVRLAAVDRQEVLETALARGAIDEGHAAVSALDPIDALVLAGPVGQNIAVLKSLPSNMTGTVVVTDVGGTKRHVLEVAANLPDRFVFVGGHPIAGSARSGFEHARGTLFFDRPWILTPSVTTPEDAVTGVEAFVRGMGAHPQRMKADEHDRVMAFVSHLPQLAVSALMAVTGSHVQAEGLSLAGGGIADTTRLASSSADTWRDVCASNADAIGAALDALTVRLTEIRGCLSRGESVDDLFNDSAHWRDVLTRMKKPVREG